MFQETQLVLKSIRKIKHSIMILTFLCLLTIIVSLPPTTLDATPESTTLLKSRFGVELSLLPPHDGTPYHSFNQSSFYPTKNLDSIQWTGPLDWYGNWTLQNWETTTVWGNPPYGGEWYDTEAIYFDMNITHIFMVIITSTPFYREWEGVWDIGVREPRWDVDNNWIRPGDLCLDFNLSDPREERMRTWSYDYGLDLIHDNRDHKYFPIWGNVYMRDYDLGSSLYKTVADPGGENIQDPGHGYDWYTASWYVESNWQHTNFDPFSVNRSASLRKIGDSYDGINVEYYQYIFPREWEDFQENNADTWIIEVSIPIRLFPNESWPPENGKMGIQWLTSCRNDGRTIDGTNLIVTVPGYLGDRVWEDTDFDGIQDPDEPGAPGVTIHLLNEEYETIDTTITDNFGTYGFSGLMPGSYYLQFDLPDGYIFSIQNTTDEENDSNADRVTGLTKKIELTPGQFDLSNDAGIYIDKENYPPLDPTIVGPSNGKKNTRYDFTIFSLDTDNDKIQYIIRWGDGETTKTGFLKSGTSTIQQHHWVNYGEYMITIFVIDNRNATASSHHTIFIDVVKIDNLINGYLVDDDSDGIYDLFINTKTGKKTFVGIENSTYLIDSDGDGRWDHIYNIEFGVSTYYDFLYKKYYQKIQPDFQETPGFEFLAVLFVMTIIIIIHNRKS